MTNNKWRIRMLQLAHLVGTWSKDPSTQVGAVITDEKNRIVSVGFNGMARGVPDEGALLLSREEKLLRILHAEDNALLFAARPVEGCTIYLTHPPCGRCASKIIQAGISQVVINSDERGFSTRWEKDIKAALTMFEAVKLHYVMFIPGELDKNKI